MNDTDEANRMLDDVFGGEDGVSPIRFGASAMQPIRRTHKCDERSCPSCWVARWPSPRWHPPLQLRQRPAWRMPKG